MTELQQVPDEVTPGDLEALGLYDPDLDFRKLALEAQYRSKGFRLVGKSALEGVPFVIIGVTYREGYMNPQTKLLGDYVSVEAVVANKEVLASPQVKHMIGGRELTIYPNEAVVFNDGGTGIRRELTELFEHMGLIKVGHENSDRPFDVPFMQWERGGDLAATGITADLNGEVFRYLCMRGLRKSEYESPYGDATTWYLS